MRRRAVLALASAATVGLIAFVLVEIASVSVGVKKAAAECNEQAPDCLPRLSMQDTEGHDWSPADLAGKVVVVNFWATWCHPCLSELPDLIALRGGYSRDDVVMLGLLTDRVSDRALEAFVNRHGVNYPVVRSTPELLQTFAFGGRLPITYIYDRSGHLQKRHLGPIRPARMRALLDDLVDER